MGLLKGKFFKEFLGILFLKGAVDIDIHKEEKNKITTKFKEKRRLSTVPQSKKNDSFKRVIPTKNNLKQGIFVSKNYKYQQKTIKNQNNSIKTPQNSENN